MSQQPKLLPVGTAGWMDLTVEDAPRIAAFYEKVIGWKTQEVPMGTYSDYCMLPENSQQPVAGVCHARGVNQNLPACWVVYFMVANIQESVHQVQAQGGKVIKDITNMGSTGRYAIIADPSGASCALFEQAVTTT